MEGTYQPEDAFNYNKLFDQTDRPVLPFRPLVASPIWFNAYDSYPVHGNKEVASSSLEPWDYFEDKFKLLGNGEQGADALVHTHMHASLSTDATTLILPPFEMTTESPMQFAMNFSD